MSVIDKQLSELGLSVRSIFVPHSHSRNAGKEICLNWRIDILYKDRVILKGVEYSQGIGHVPNYNKYSRKTIHNMEMLNTAAEQGVIAQEYSYGWGLSKNRIEPPDLGDIIQCLVLDADALNYISFEDWAPAFGYDEDSRKAERLYLQCLAIGLQLKNGLGNKIYQQVVELCNEY